MRPVVDDVGQPGYFIKEIPLLPASAAILYDIFGGVDERIGRMLSVVGWLAGVPVLAAILSRALPPHAIAVGVGWWLVAPLAVVYARAFMTDATMVTTSLGAFLAMSRFREHPSAKRAAASAALVGLSLLLKPHAVFWLGPAGCVLLLARPGDNLRRPTNRWLSIQGATLGLAAAVAAGWYLHAASVHRQYPAPGTTGIHGWFSATALFSPALYIELLRQIAFMVFTPLGVAVAAVGLVLDRRYLGLVELALCAWGVGVVGQCLVFDTRLFDEAARGTEYYQLAMMPVAALFVGRGAEALARRIASAHVGAVVSVIFCLVLTGAALQVCVALTLPERYARILPDCEIIQQKTLAHDELFVLADRGGTILYYCDRRGTTFVPARAVSRVFAHEDNVVGVRQIADALDRATYVYVPFPDLLGEDSRWLSMFDENFDRVDTPGSDMRLYRQRTRTR